MILLTGIDSGLLDADLFDFVCDGWGAGPGGYPPGPADLSKGAGPGPL